MLLEFSYLWPWTFCNIKECRFSLFFNTPKRSKIYNRHQYDVFRNELLLVGRYDENDCESTSRGEHFELFVISGFFFDIRRVFAVFTEDHRCF